MIKTHEQKLLVGFIIFLSVLCGFVWFLMPKVSSDVLSIYFLDVGQGDAIFIEAPNKKQLLIDGGRNSALVNELSKFMKFSDREIDVVLATHPDGDHIGGLPEIFDRFEIGNFVDTGNKGDTNLYKELMDKAKKEDSSYFIAKRGLTIILDKKNGVYFQVLAPDESFNFPDINDTSIVGRLVYGKRSFLLTGDASKAVENVLVYSDEDLLKSDILKAGHHGSKTSSGLLFLEKVLPEVSIISASKNNSYGHPHDSVINNLKSINSAILETSKEGTIVFKTNGTDLWRE